MNIKPIYTKEDYKAALEVVKGLMNTTEGEDLDTLEVVSILIEEYENKHFPMPELKQWTMKITSRDGKISMHRTNDGFNAFELLGLLEVSRNDILNQIKGTTKPDVIKRQVIEPKSAK